MCGCSLVFVCVVTVFGTASSVCYACHWRGMGQPKPTQAATWKPPRPEPGFGGHHGEHADAEPLRGLGEDE